jgi:pre-rRNA-processing protein IPI3
MNEVVIVTSSKDAGGGMGVVDLATGTPVCSNFKNCIAEPGSVCLTGVGYSSFSGAGACGDFIAVAQSKKPVINIYQWNKSQVLHQCHIQEITTSLASDPSGTFIFGGTKRGWIYAWEATSGALIVSWQAHFKSVTRLAVSDTGDFLISASEDGMARAWELAAVLDQSDTYGRAASASTRKNMSPYR